ncbi:MAG TPA: hypothetical protein PKW82_08045 [Spirochaetales bacterium]|nr:hypothetical protein [Spirochaetales bacterium]
MPEPSVGFLVPALARWGLGFAIFALALGTLGSGLAGRRARIRAKCGAPAPAAPSRESVAALAALVREARRSGYYRDKLVARCRKLAAGAVNLASGRRCEPNVNALVADGSIDDEELLDFLCEEHLVSAPRGAPARRTDEGFARRLEAAIDAIEILPEARTRPRAGNAKGGTEP